MIKKKVKPENVTLLQKAWCCGRKQICLNYPLYNALLVKQIYDQKLPCAQK